MRVLLISTYELGHQPLHVATAASALLAEGHEVRCIDLAIETWNEESVQWADKVAFSVPMHTAMRLAQRAAQRIRGERPHIPIAFFGLYAGLEHHDLHDGVVNATFAGSYEARLVEWAQNIDDHRTSSTSGVDLSRGVNPLPARHLLPNLTRYAHLAITGEERPVGYVEASRGCVHTCRHCPVPIVYDGRIRIVNPDIVLADIDQQADAGARHITFGDPDFLNGVRHSRRIIEAMHANHPDLTFDMTAKVEHILEFAHLWPEFASAGCLFVVSAFESMNATILEYLDKGHAPGEAAQAVQLLRRHGIEIRPSWMPFTPWTEPNDLLDILTFVHEHDLIPNVDPVHYTIRLLLPKGSLLLDLPQINAHVETYDPQRLSYRWTATDPRADTLQKELATLVERDVIDETPITTTFLRIWEKVRTADLSTPKQTTPNLSIDTTKEMRPRLTEPWFC